MPNPVDFSANVTVGQSPLTVTFTPSISSVVRILKYTWSFGDGKKSNEESPVHVYIEGGDFTVTLDVLFADHTEYENTKSDFISVYKIKIVASENSGNVPFTVKFGVASSLPKNVIISSFDWDFGDGTDHSSDESPIHIYSTVKDYLVRVTVTFALDTLTTPTPLPYIYSSSLTISATQPEIKMSGKMTCLGWIRSLTVEDGDVLIPLAVADPYENVIGTDAAIRMEILREGLDYRLQYSNSKSKLIDKVLKININDGSWHFLGYECNENGEMGFYVDALALASEDGLDSYGLPFSTAKSTASRVGGGAVWAPYLYKRNQVIYQYNWRFGKDFNLGQEWIQKLMDKDKQILKII